MGGSIDRLIGERVKCLGEVMDWDDCFATIGRNALAFWRTLLLPRKLGRDDEPGDRGEAREERWRIAHARALAVMCRGLSFVLARVESRQ